MAIHKYTVQEGVNAQLGQCRSAFLDQYTSGYTPASGEAVIAITIVQDAKFDTLTSETKNFCVGTDGTDGAYAGVTPGDRIPAATLFIAGLVLNGRWSFVKLDAGSVILHIAS